MKKKSAFRDVVSMNGLSFLLVMIGFIDAYQFVGPAPTKNLAIAIGR